MSALCFYPQTGPALRKCRSGRRSHTHLALLGIPIARNRTITHVNAAWTRNDNTFLATFLAQANAYNINSKVLHYFDLFNKHRL